MKRLVPAALLWALPLHAQPSDTFQKAQAEALFQEGRALAASGDCTRAIPKLAASEALESSPGTLLNLADCYEKLGKTASAWVSYRSAASLARARGQSERETAARERVKVLEPELSYLKLDVPSDTPDLEIQLDGARVEPAVFGSSFPVDPGARVLIASRPGHVTWKTTIQVPDKRGALRVEVPALVPLATTAPVVAPETSPGTKAPPFESERRRPAPSSQKTWAFVVGGVGVAGFGVAGVFSLLSLGKNSDSKEHCEPGDETRCTARGDELRDQARGYADVATVGTIVGALGVGTGLVLWLTAPSSDSRWSAGFRGSQLSVQKRF
jgi:serine/threonine-protein kinase